MDVAFILLIKSFGDHGLDLEYLRRRWLTKLPGLDLDEAAHELDERFIATGFEEVANIANEESPHLPQSYFLEAERFQEEAKVHDYISKQNLQQGIAPSRKLVIEFRRKLKGSHDEDIAHEVPSIAVRAGEKKWIQRFRVRWGLSTGRLPAGDVLELEDLRRKVLHCRKATQKAANCAGPDFAPGQKQGPHSGPRFGDHLVLLAQTVTI